MIGGVISNDWPAPIRTLVTTRHLLGNSLPPYDSLNLGTGTGENPAVVRANRELVGRKFDLPSAPRWLRQVHGSNAVSFDRSPQAAAGAILKAEECNERVGGNGDERAADAAYTTQTGVVLAVLTADCLPLLVCAGDGTEIAAIHAGWRGLAAGVIERCIENLRTPHARLLVWLGPAIGPRSYEVGEEVRATFVAQDRTNTQAFVPTRAGHWHCDLYTLAQRRLRALGVTRIYGGEFDTFTDARFYSYRRDGITGRFASLIWIAD